MRVLVLGASGFLGRSIGDELLSRRHDVVAVSRSGAASATMLAQASVVRADLTTAGDAELDALHDGVDAVVHCLGPDDRDTLAVPVSASLDRLLVGTTVRAAHTARRAGVTAFVVLGSYFSTFDRLHPHLLAVDRDEEARAAHLAQLLDQQRAILSRQVAQEADRGGGADGGLARGVLGVVAGGVAQLPGPDGAAQQLAHQHAHHHHAHDAAAQGRGQEAVAPAESSAPHRWLSHGTPRPRPRTRSRCCARS